MPNSQSPAAPDCQVVELRQYTLHPGRRETLIALFEREFVETQEAVGLRVIGQFRDLDDERRFVWLRGFADMAARAPALQSFYGGPVWAAHRAAANATMEDSDNVLLLRPAWPGGALPPGRPRAEPRATEAAAGALGITVFPLQTPAAAELLARCRDTLAPSLRDWGAREQAWYVTEPAANNFPRLPVREGEPVLVALGLFADIAALDRGQAGGGWRGEAARALAPWLAGPAQVLRLSPTRRSALRAD